MMSVHKNIQSFKRDAILLILFDLILLAVNIERNRGIIFTAPTLKSIVLNFVVYTVTNAWWAIDSKDWIADKHRRKFIWSYILFGAAMLLGIGLLTIIGQLVAASVLVYMLVLYYAFGIWLIMRYI